MTTEVKAMELKKTSSTAKANEDSRFSIFNFVGNIKEEFGKITWTNPQELRTYTKIVVGATFLLGIGIYCVDLTIQLILSVLGFLFHSVFG